MIVELTDTEVAELRRLQTEAISNLHNNKLAVLANVKQNFTADNIATLLGYYNKRLDILKSILKKFHAHN